MTNDKLEYREDMAFLKQYIPKDKLAKFCRKHHIRKLSLFGSALRGQLHPDSDIDLLVEFEPGHVKQKKKIGAPEIVEE